MASSDGRSGCDSQSLGGYAAVIVSGVLLLGFMPFSVRRVDVDQTIEPRVKQAESMPVVEMLPEPPAAETPILKPRVEPKADATGTTSRVFERLRAMERQPRYQVRPVVDPLREPDTQPKRRGERPGAAERLFDEFP
ncbi:hypothetical protein AYO47_05750 [Planctomyces sp. SCGC AG-212-M04]|nr:hypothetical protein AYO47_05750 [Planctomyces sp. SCGC AG-212-M04]